MQGPALKFWRGRPSPPRPIAPNSSFRGNWDLGPSALGFLAKSNFLRSRKYLSHFPSFLRPPTRRAGTSRSRPTKSYFEVFYFYFWLRLIGVCVPASRLAPDGTSWCHFSLTEVQRPWASPGLCEGQKKIKCKLPFGAGRPRRNFNAGPCIKKFGRPTPPEF